MIYFTTHTFKCVCHCRRAMFRLLGMYNFALTLNFDPFETNMTKLNPKIALTESIYIKYQFRFGCTKRRLANNFYFS